MMRELIQGVIISADKELVDRIGGLWPADQAAWQVYSRGGEAMQGVLNSLPAVIIVSMKLPDIDGMQIVNMLKSENVYSQVPILLCLNEEEFSGQKSFEDFLADDFYILPGSDAEFKNRIMLTVLRATRNLDANPLSHLPGNTSIIRYVQSRIDNKDDFAMCYCDLDYFKSFNDKYGFIRGDEVLLMSARLILNTVRAVSPGDFFVGHVGGDDFVFVLPADKAEDACKRIIAAFDAIVPQFYDKADRDRGSIVAPDRQGQVRTFPLMAISIAVICNTGSRLEHVGQASAISMSLKKKAKEKVTSCYVMDRRSV